MTAKQQFKRLLRAVLIGLVLGGLVMLWRAHEAKYRRLNEVRTRVAPSLRQELAAAGFALGDQLFIRIFKESREMELWLHPAGSTRFRLFQTYPVYFSGKLGPKLEEGDGQAPEGFYTVDARSMNPNSDFHLSFNIGYPNKYDLAHGRSGSFIMVHGGNASIGCFAMSDPIIEKIYLIADAALQRGQGSFPVHILPFRMTDERLAAASDTPWQDYWQNLREGYDRFEATHTPPEVSVADGKYRFE